MPVKRGEKQLAENRKARHEYFIEDTYECGMALVGTEVKSIRLGKVNIKDSYVKIKNGEAFVVGMHISPYEKGNIFNRDPFRERKLLLHKREILKLLTLSQADGYSLIPLRLYLKDGKVKLELAVAKGKKLYDKRHDIAERDAKRAQAKCRCLLTKSSADFADCPFGSRTVITQTHLLHIIRVAAWFCLWYNINAWGRTWFRRGSWVPDKRAEAPSFAKIGKT